MLRNDPLLRPAVTRGTRYEPTIKQLGDRAHAQATGNSSARLTIDSDAAMPPLIHSPLNSVPWRLRERLIQDGRCKLQRNPLLCPGVFAPAHCRRKNAAQ